MHLTVASIVRNEADRFLASALEAWRQFADRICVLDDGSTDETPDILAEAGVEYHRQEPLMFGEEWKARRKLWRLAADGAEWILHLDADQVPSRDPRPHLRGPVCAFRVYDLWSEDEYRSDAWWTGHKRCWWPAVHVPSLPDGFEDEWPERGWHSGHVPSNVPGPVRPVDGCAILHYAYSAPDLRGQKAKMYACLGEHLTKAERFHAGTILSPNPNTEPLPFEPEWRLTR